MNGWTVSVESLKLSRTQRDCSMSKADVITDVKVCKFLVQLLETKCAGGAESKQFQILVRCEALLEMVRVNL